jgi:hypothetical protein
MIDPFRTATPATLWQSDSSTTSRRPAALLFCVHSLRLTIRDSRSPMMKSFLFGNDRVAFYDDGVGTSMFKPWAILGGAFGFGLKRNVIDIYKFARPRRLQDPGQLKPTRDGELFIFVNDAVIGIPGLYDFFYRHNGGGGMLTVTRR